MHVWTLSQVASVVVLGELVVAGRMRDRDFILDLSAELKMNGLDNKISIIEENSIDSRIISQYSKSQTRALLTTIMISVLRRYRG